MHYVEHNDEYQPNYQEATMENYGRISEEVNYVGNQGNFQFQPNNNLSYRSQNVENPQDQVYPPFQRPQGQNNYQNQRQGYFQPRPFVQQGQENYQENNYGNQGGYQGQWGNQNRGSSFNNQSPSNNNYAQKQQYNNFQQRGGNSAQPPQDDDVKNMLKQILEGQGSTKKDISEMKACYGDLNSKFEGLATHVKGLENQIAQVASTSRNNGKCILPGKPEQNPKEYCQAIMLRSGKELPSGNTADGSIDSREKTEKPEEKELSVEKEAHNDVLAEENVSEEKKGKEAQETPKTEEKTEDKTEYVPPPYEPKLPFPGRFKKQTLDKQYEKFKKLLETVEITMPLTDLVLDCPIYNKLLKDIITKKRMIEEAMVQVNHECSAILQKNLPKKLQDPGSFTLPCTIGPMSFGKCLVDLGASVSLMPLTVSRKLGLTNFKKTRISLVLADRSTRYPIGILENVPLKIGECLIPTDFVVLEMDREPTDPIILGRPFLATAGAIIDVKNGIIDLHMGSSVLKFDIMEAVKKPTIEKKVFSMEEHEAKKDELLEENVENLLENVLLVEKGEYELDADIKEDKKQLNSLKVDKGHKDFLELKQRVHSMEMDGFKTEEISTEEAEINDEWSELITPKTTCTHPPPANQPAQKRVRKRKKIIRTDQEEVRSIPKMGRVTRE